MRKRILSLVLTFALVLSVAVARPPTAKASLAITASVAGAALLAIAGASGIQIASQGYDSEGIYEAIQDWISDNLAERFTDVQDFLDELNDMNAPITPGGGPGKFIISAAATALFTELLGNIVTSFGLADGGEPVVLEQTGIDGLTFSSSMFDVSFPFITVFSNDWYSGSSQWCQCLTPCSFTLQSDGVPVSSGYIIKEVAISAPKSIHWDERMSSAVTFNYTQADIDAGCVFSFIICNRTSGNAVPGTYQLSNSDILTDLSGLSPASSLAASIPDTLALPAEGEDLELTVPGSEAETVEDLAADVYDQVANNTLSPIIEVTDPETVTGTLTGIKEGILNLPQRIGEAIKSLFAPDADFFPEAIADLQEAFDDRFGLLTYPISILADFIGEVLQIADQAPILRWNSVSIFGRELIPAGQYNLNEALSSSAFHTVHDVYLVVVDAVMILAFVELCRKKYRSLVHN